MVDIIDLIWQKGVTEDSSITFVIGLTLCYPDVLVNSSFYRKIKIIVRYQYHHMTRSQL